MEPTRDNPATVILSPERLDAFGAMPFHDGLVALWNDILATCGLPSLADSSEPVKPGAFRIPKADATRLLDAWIAKASPIDRPSIMMTWCNVGPSVSDVERGAYFTGPTFPPASLV